MEKEQRQLAPKQNENETKQMQGIDPKHPKTQDISLKNFPKSQKSPVRSLWQETDPLLRELKRELQNFEGGPPKELAKGTLKEGHWVFMVFIFPFVFIFLKCVFTFLKNKYFYVFCNVVFFWVGHGWTMFVGCVF